MCKRVCDRGVCAGNRSAFDAGESTASIVGVVLNAFRGAALLQFGFFISGIYLMDNVISCGVLLHT